MLPDLRFVIGAGLATTLLVATTFGVVATLRLAHQAKMGPFESSRSLAYADQTDWNQFQDPTAARRFDDMTRPIGSESVPPSLNPPADVATDAPQPVAPSPIPGPPAPDIASASVSNLPADVAQDTNVAGGVPQDGTAAPVADDHTAHLDLEPVPAPAATTGAPVPDAAATAATGPDVSPSVQVAARDLPATAPATTEPAITEPPATEPAAIEPATPEPATIAPVIAAPAPIAEPSAGSEVDRVASIPATSPVPMTAVEPTLPMPRAAPTHRQLAKAAPRAKRAVHRSRQFAARARAIRLARARAARARQAAQQPFAPTGFTATTGPFNNRRFNTTGFNNDRSFGSPGGN